MSTRNDNLSIRGSATSPDVDEVLPERSAPVGFLGYLRILRRRWLIVVGVLVVALLAAAAVTYKQKPLYQAQSKIVVGQGNTLFQPQNGNEIQPFTATMSNLLTSNIVADQVRTRLGLSESSTRLLANVSVSINPQTSVMLLTVTDPSPERARAINAAFGVVFIELARTRFAQASQGINAPAQASGGINGPPISATVFDPAHIVPGKVSPSPAQNLLIAGILGLLLGVAAAFVREHFDPIVRTEDELEEAFDCAVIGRIPAHRNARRGGRVATNRNGRGTISDVVWDGRPNATEAYRMLRATLGSRAWHAPLRTVVVASVASRGDQSAVAANLAFAFARAGARTLLVEGDLREPLLDQAIGHDRLGLTGVLTGRGALAEAVEANVGPARQLSAPDGRPDRPSPEPDHPPLDFLAAGVGSGNASDLLASARMTELIDEAASDYEHVVFDAPPLLLAADALELARSVDGVILVTKPGQVRGDQAREVRAMIDRLSVHLAGLVVTGADGVRGTRERAAALERRDPLTVPVTTSRSWVSERSL